MWGGVGLGVVDRGGVRMGCEIGSGWMPTSGVWDWEWLDADLWGVGLGVVGSEWLDAHLWSLSAELLVFFFLLTDVIEIRSFVRVCRKRHGQS